MPITPQLMKSVSAAYEVLLSSWRTEKRQSTKRNWCQIARDD